MDCLVTHPAAASYAAGASQLAGFAAAKVETNKRRACKVFTDGGSYEFFLLADKCFGRLGQEVAHFLSDLSEVAASDGCA